MTLLESLLDAIVRLDGDSLVMHVGEKPYVVTTSSAMSSLRGPLCWGQVELSSRSLTADAVLGMLSHMLPAEQRRLFDEVGAIEHEIQSSACPGPPFILTAARGGDDVWVEVRRKPPIAETDAVEIPVAEAPVDVAGEPDAVSGVAPVAEPEAPIDRGAGHRAVHDDVHEIEVPANFEWAPGEAAPRIVVAAERSIIAPSKPEPVLDLSEQALVFTPWASEVIDFVEPAIEFAQPEPAVEPAEPGQDQVGAVAEPEPVGDLPEPERAIELEPATMRLAPDPAIAIVEDNLPTLLELAPEATATPEPPVAQPALVQMAKPALKLQPTPITGPSPAASTEASLVALVEGGSRARSIDGVRSGRLAADGAAGRRNRGPRHRSGRHGGGRRSVHVRIRAARPGGRVHAGMDVRGEGCRPRPLRDVP